jgi:hypothetical protein
MITYHCDECGKQVEEYCAEHPRARVSSVVGEWPRLKYETAKCGFCEAPAIRVSCNIGYCRYHAGLGLRSD